MPKTVVKKIDIAYDDLGKGEPALLLLPGWCIDRRVFQDLLPLSSPKRRTLALDWRGHGESERQAGDFGNAELVEDALSVIEASGAGKVAAVAMAHAGWVAIELRRRLGARIDRLVLLDWIITEPPLPFLEVLTGMQNPKRWKQIVEQTIERWLRVDNPRLIRFVHQVMESYGFEMWARAAREIRAAYSNEGSPLRALGKLDPPVPTLHLFSRMEDPAALSAQKAFAATHPWFRAKKLKSRSHFPMFEVPEQIATEIAEFCG